MDIALVLNIPRKERTEMSQDESRTERQGPQRVVRGFQERKRTLPRWEAANVTYSVRASAREERSEELTQPGIAEIVRGSLHHQDGRRYTLHFYTIMSTHIHAVFAPLPRDDGSVPLPEIMHALKSFTAHPINKLTGTTGSFWLDE